MTGNSIIKVNLLSGGKATFSRIVRPCIAAAAVLAMLVPFMSEPLAAEHDAACVSCHEKEADGSVSAERGRVHWRAGVGCVDCHGGDPAQQDKEAAKAEGTGYRGKIEKRAVPGLCGGCHSDVRMMNPYGLPTDQLAQYKTSHHGEALYGEGDTEVAACVDCHHAHGILAPRDPESPVYPKNVPATCGRCHSDAEKMSRHGLEGDEEDLFRRSVHAEMLFEKNDLSAPTCVTCHGNHGAVPPGFARVGLVCGKCHVKQKELFDQGPHAVPAGKGEIETCVDCHGNHKVVAATRNLFRTCTLCHDKGEKPYETAKEIYTLLGDAEEVYEAALEEVESASAAGLETDDEQVLMADARTHLMQLPPLQHRLDLDDLEKTSAEVEKIAEDVEQRIHKKREAIKLRKLALVPLSFFLLSMSFGFWLKSRRVRKNGNNDES